MNWILINGSLTSNQDAIREHFAGFYENYLNRMLYVYRRSLLDGLHFISINEALGLDGDSET